MASRSFGSLQWDCVRPGSHWTFDDGWGTFHLRHYNNRGQEEGWYLDTPDGSGDWMGRTLSEAAEASQRIVHDSHPRRVKR
jgi:hypothetical protein